MSGLCGWIGGGAGSAELDAMRAALPAYGDCGRDLAVRNGAALALNAREHEGYWYEDEAVLVAIEGYPRWTGAEPDGARTNRTIASTVGKAWQRHGRSMIESLGGPFTLVLIDKQKGEALLAVDRAGIGTLCVADAPGGGIVFGSTTGAVARYPGIGKTVSPQTLYNFLYFVDRIPAPATIFDEQKKLVPGEFLHFADGGAERGLYWRMAYPDRNGAGFEDYSKTLIERLRGAVARSVEGERLDCVGAFLSGGLDSSTVVALLSEQSADPARTFTISFSEDDFDESFYADKVVKKFGSLHHQYAVTPKDTFDAIPLIADIYDEPYGNHSAVPAFYCAKMAKEAGTGVLLAGDGGDELFAGNSRYVDERVFNHYHSLPGPLRRAVIEPVLTAFAQAFPSVNLFRRARNYIVYANQPVPVRMARYNVLEQAGLAETFVADAATAIDPEVPMRFVEALYDGEAASSMVQAMMSYDRRITLADSDLRKVNRMCELAGVRVRYPFLDDSVVEFSGTLPEDMLLEGGVLRAFYKKVVADLLPPEVIAKKKQGFGLPFVAYSDAYPPLMDLVCDSVTDLKKRNIFRADYLDRLIAHHRCAANGRSRIGFIWDFMMVELWWQRHG